MRHAPGLRLPIHAPLPQEELPQPVPRPQPIRQDILADADDIAGGFLGPGWDPDRRQLSRPVQARQFLGVPAVRLHAVARPHRRQGRGHHRTRLAQRGELPLHFVPAGARLVDKRHRASRREPGHQACDCRGGVLKRHGLSRPICAWGEYGRNHCCLVYIQTNDCATIVHEPAPPYVDRLPSPMLGSNPRYYAGRRLVHYI